MARGERRLARVAWRRADREFGGGRQEIEKRVVDRARSNAARSRPVRKMLRSAAAGNTSPDTHTSGSGRGRMPHVRTEPSAPAPVTAARNRAQARGGLSCRVSKKNERRPRAFSASRMLGPELFRRPERPDSARTTHHDRGRTAPNRCCSVPLEEEQQKGSAALEGTT